MNKHKINDNNVLWNCCPMGTLRDDSVVDCYYYGFVTVPFCEKCDVRKDGKITYSNSK